MREIKPKTCKNCKKTYVRKNARFYCLQCAKTIKKNLHRKQNQKYQQSGRKVDAYKKRQEKIKRRGIKINQEIKKQEYNGNEARGIKVTIKNVHEFSKNKILMSRTGRPIYTAKRSRAKEDLIWEIKSLKPYFFQSKIWLGITVYKKDNKGDAINCIDTIADAIEKGIGINDKWYAIRYLDWYIDKIDPRIEIVITQETKEHHDICSKCGRILPLSKFPKSISEKIERTIKSGINHKTRKICKDCNH